MNLQAACFSDAVLSFFLVLAGNNNVDYNWLVFTLFPFPSVRSLHICFDSVIQRVLSEVRVLS